jgi:ketosteroid isomerase-like protein
MKPLLPIALVLLLASCGQGQATESLRQSMELEITDIHFSALSRDSGIRIAFLRYKDSSAVLLRPGHFPLQGAVASQYLLASGDTSVTLTWIPTHSEVASSGDLGYTYGVYTLRSHSSDSAVQGTYVSIWKKQPDGSWKYVLDSGNPGVGK